MRDLAIKQLAEYGYTLTSDNRIAKGDKVFDLVVTFKHDRMRIDLAKGGKMFTGTELGKFVESFWFAKKIAP